MRLIHCSLFAIVVLSAMTSLWASEPIDVGDRVCLFLDDHFVASRNNLERQWHSGEPHPTAILIPDKPWEGWVFMYGSVLYEPKQKRFRMWYQSWDGSLNYKVCYAESSDGLTWKKPELGLWEYDGSKQYNIVIPGCAMPNVFIDPLPKIGDPLKMFVWAASHPDKTIHRHSLFSSKDSLRWEYLGWRKFGLDCDSGRWIKDANVIRWDERNGRWAAAHRSWTKFPIGEKNDEWRRTVLSTYSDRLLEGWSPLELVLKPDEFDDKTTSRLSQNPKKPDWSELYGMPIFQYRNHELGMLSVLDLIDGSDRVIGGGRMELAFSHDGQQWHRTSPRVRLIESDPKRADLVAIYAMTTPPIERDDRLWVYYTEANSMHPLRPSDRWTTCIRLATWRKDQSSGISSSGDDARGFG